MGQGTQSYQGRPIHRYIKCTYGVGDPSLVRLVRAYIVDLKVREGIQTLLDTLSEVQVLIVVLFVRSLDIRQRFILDVLICCIVRVTCYSFCASFSGTIYFRRC